MVDGINNSKKRCNLNLLLLNMTSGAEGKSNKLDAKVMKQ